MSVAEELRQTVEHVRSVAPPPVFSKLESAIAALQGDGVAQRGVAVGDRPKQPVLNDVQGRAVDLAAMNAAGPLVITFYRGGWCPYCNVELRGLPRIDAELRQHDAAQVAVTPEAPSHGAATAAEAGVTFPVLHDAELAFARALGIVFQPTGALREAHDAFGLDLQARNQAYTDELPLAVTLVLDRGGKVVWTFKDADWTKRAEPSDIVAAVAAIAAH